MFCNCSGGFRQSDVAHLCPLRATNYRPTCPGIVVNREPKLVGSGWHAWPMVVGLDSFRLLSQRRPSVFTSFVGKCITKNRLRSQVRQKAAESNRDTDQTTCRGQA